MRLRFYFAVFSFFIPIAVFSQSGFTNGNICGTDIYHEQLLQDHPEWISLKEQADNIVTNSNFQPQYETRGTEVIRIIPVVFHIIHMNGEENISETVIQDQIRRLNVDFRKQNSDTIYVRSQFTSIIANMGYEFRLARIDPNGKCTNGITRYYSTETENVDKSPCPVKSLPGQWWDNKKYLNIWVVKSINSDGSAGTILGFSTLAQYAAQDPYSDGIVMRADRIGWAHRTLTHEVGHYVGLQHTFQGGCGGSNCATSGDKICDTPPVAEENFGCDKSTNSCSNDSPDLPDQIENYMDYTDCTFMFTNGQKNAVNSIMNIYRATLISQSNLIATGVYDTNSISCKLVADFTADHPTMCAGIPIKFENTSFLSSTVQYKWTFQNGTPTSSTQKNPSVSWTSPGNYNVKLVITNTLGKDSITKNAFVSIYPMNGYNSPMFEDFEKSTFVNDYWVMSEPSEGLSWVRTNKAGFGGGYSLYVNNFTCSTKDLTISFTLPPFDLRGISNPRMTYKHAFAKRLTSSADKLRIYASTDCGVTWSLRDSKTLNKLPTTGQIYASEFIPLAAEWASSELSLINYSNESKLLIKFDFITALGNNIYIDNINIGNASVIESNPGAKNTFSVFPNPAKDQLSLIIPETLQPQELTIQDLLGNIIYKKSLPNQQIRQLNYSLTELSINKPGIYIIKLSDGINIYNQRITVIE